MIIPTSGPDSKLSKVVIGTEASSASQIQPERIHLLHSFPVLRMYPHQKTSAAWRFFKNLLAAGVIYIVFVIPLQSLVALAKNTLIEVITC
jgi:hypothetical protein